MTIQRSILIFLLIITTTSYGQKRTVIPGNLSPIFDISPDNKNVVLAISNGPISNLYTFSLTDDKLTQLTNDKSYYSRPVFSPDGDKILFLSKDLEAEKSNLSLIDLKTNQITKLTDGTLYITEGAFMPRGNGIIFCGAEVITNYSPLARKAPHDIDLYSINSDGSAQQKLTNFSAYEFSNINLNQTGDTLLCKLIVNGVEGIYLLSLSDTVKSKIEAINNPRPQIGESFYGSPSYAKDNQQISFTAPYQLYTLNLSDRKCMEVWSTFGKDDQAMPIFSRFDSTGKKLFFSVLGIVNRQYSRSAQIYSYDFETKKSTQLFIPMTK